MSGRLCMNEKETRLDNPSIWILYVPIQTKNLQIREERFLSKTARSPAPSSWPPPDTRTWTRWCQRRRPRRWGSQAQGRRRRGEDLRMYGNCTVGDNAICGKRKAWKVWWIAEQASVHKRVRWFSKGVLKRKIPFLEYVFANEVWASCALSQAHLQWQLRPSSSWQETCAALPLPPAPLRLPSSSFQRHPSSCSLPCWPCRRPCPCWGLNFKKVTTFPPKKTKKMVFLPGLSSSSSSFSSSSSSSSSSLSSLIRYNSVVPGRTTLHFKQKKYTGIFF